MKSKRLLFVHVPLLLLFISGCANLNTEEDTNKTAMPTPTTHPFFSPKTKTPPPPTKTPLPPTPPGIDTAIPPTPTLDLTGIEVITIYDDALDQDWAVAPSSGVVYQLQDERNAYTGRNSISFSPAKEGDSLLFRVRPDAARQFPRPDVLAISFWLYAEEDYIRFDDLNVTVLGSNDFPYWVRNDDSANTDIPTFSQTRRYGLGLNTPIPPKTWINILVFLDQLVYDPNFDEQPVEDPEYEYLTGFSIDYVTGFWNTVYIDDVAVFLLTETP